MQQRAIAAQRAAGTRAPSAVHVVATRGCVRLILSETRLAAGPAGPAGAEGGREGGAGEGAEGGSKGPAFDALGLGLQEPELLQLLLPPWLQGAAESVTLCLGSGRTSAKAAAAAAGLEVRAGQVVRVVPELGFAISEATPPVLAAPEEEATEVRLQLLVEPTGSSAARGSGTAHAGRQLLLLGQQQQQEEAGGAAAQAKRGPRSPGRSRVRGDSCSSCCVDYMAVTRRPRMLLKMLGQGISGLYSHSHSHSHGSVVTAAAAALPTDLQLVASCGGVALHAGPLAAAGRLPGGQVTVQMQLPVATQLPSRVLQLLLASGSSASARCEPTLRLLASQEVASELEGAMVSDDGCDADAGHVPVLLQDAAALLLLLEGSGGDTADCCTQAEGAVAGTPQAGCSGIDGPSKQALGSDGSGEGVSGAGGSAAAGAAQQQGEDCEQQHEQQHQAESGDDGLLEPFCAVVSELLAAGLYESASWMLGRWAAAGRGLCCGSLELPGSSTGDAAAGATASADDTAGQVLLQEQAAAERAAGIPASSAATAGAAASQPGSVLAAASLKVLHSQACAAAGVQAPPPPGPAAAPARAGAHTSIKQQHTRSPAHQWDQLSAQQRLAARLDLRIIFALLAMQTACTLASAFEGFYAPFPLPLIYTLTTLCVLALRVARPAAYLHRRWLMLTLLRATCTLLALHNVILWNLGTRPAEVYGKPGLLAASGAVGAVLVKVVFMRVHLAVHVLLQVGCAAASPALA